MQYGHDTIGITVTVDERDVLAELDLEYNQDNTDLLENADLDDIFDRIQDQLVDETFRLINAYRDEIRDKMGI